MLHANNQDITATLNDVYHISGVLQQAHRHMAAQIYFTKYFAYSQIISIFAPRLGGVTSARHMEVALRGVVLTI